MRAIKKGVGDRLLNDRQATYLRQIATHIAVPPERAWTNFRRKQGTRANCRNEQFGLCAYSEIVLDDNDLGIHIDHVEPKSRRPDRCFDHDNLVLSAISDAKLGDMPKTEVFGGHYRRDRYSRAGFINPLWSDSRRYFHYAISGKVEPSLGLSASEARKVRYTITVLNLNSPLLVTRRRVWLQVLEEQIALLLSTQAELRQFAEGILCDNAGQLPNFHSASRERFDSLDRLGQAVIAQHCLACD
jgi:uncharacterized protein (TIGR02646 family)